MKWIERGEERMKGNERRRERGKEREDRERERRRGGKRRKERGDITNAYWQQINGIPWLHSSVTNRRQSPFCYPQPNTSEMFLLLLIRDVSPPPPPPPCHWLRCTHRGDMHSSATADLGALCVDMKCSQDEDEAGECLQQREQGAVLWTER